MMAHPVTWTGLLGIPEQFQYLATGIVVMLGILLLAARARAALVAESAIVPDASLSPRTIFELLVESIGGLAETVIGPHSERYVPFHVALFAFILIANLLGLVPGFAPPTSSFNITFGLGLCSFIVFNYYGFRQQGTKYIAHMAGPVWWLAWLLLPIELIGVLVRPFSLGLRLFGNLFGDHLVLEIFTDLTKLVVPVVFYFLGTLVSVIQAFVFLLLSLIYIALSVADEH